MEKMKEISRNSHIIHPGLKIFRKGGGGKRIQISDIPGIRMCPYYPYFD